MSEGGEESEEHLQLRNDCKRRRAGQTVQYLSLIGMIALGIASGYKLSGMCPKHKHFGQNLKKKKKKETSRSLWGGCSREPVLHDNNVAVQNKHKGVESNNTVWTIQSCRYLTLCIPVRESRVEPRAGEQRGSVAGLAERCSAVACEKTQFEVPSSLTLL